MSTEDHSQLQEPQVFSVSAVAQRMLAAVDDAAAGMPQHPVPGLAVAITIDGSEPIVKTFGVADRRTGAALTPRSLFRACSMTKPYTAMMIVRLAAQGVIDLDRPIVDSLKRWAFAPDRTGGFDPRGVTLRRILSHTAGLNIHTYDQLPKGAPIPDPAELLTGVAGMGEAFHIKRQPGSSFDYSGAAFTLARVAVEDATGRSFEQLMNQLVIGPMGFRDTTLSPTPEQRSRLCSGHDPAGEPVDFCDFADMSASGMIVSPAEVARFYSVVMRRGQAPAGWPLLDEPWALEMISDQRRGATGRSFGLGFQVQTHLGETLYRHAGCRRGWWGHAEGHPAHRAVFVTMSNAELGGKVIEPLIARLRRVLDDFAPVEASP